MTTLSVSHTQQSYFTFLITSSQARNGPLVLVHTASLLDCLSLTSEDITVSGQSSIEEVAELCHTT